MDDRGTKCAWGAFSCSLPRRPLFLRCRALSFIVFRPRVGERGRGPARRYKRSAPVIAHTLSCPAPSLNNVPTTPANHRTPGPTTRATPAAAVYISRLTRSASLRRVGARRGRSRRRRWFLRAAVSGCMGTRAPRLICSARARSRSACAFSEIYAARDLMRAGLARDPAYPLWLVSQIVGTHTAP